jgi:hypothetical protein
MNFFEKFAKKFRSRQLQDLRGRSARPREHKTMEIPSNTEGHGAAVAEQASKALPQHIEVVVITTSGTWPEEGFDSVPIHQPIRVQLQQAAKKLKITDTTGWMATVGGRELNIEQNYLENQLDGQVQIDYGPREGGGGNE